MTTRAGFIRFLQWADSRNLVSVRATVLGVTVWMTWRVTVWAFDLTRLWMLTDKPGIEVAAVIAAVTAPFAALQVFAFRSYLGASDK